MIRSKKGTLVVPMLGGLLVPTAPSVPPIAGMSTASSATRRRRLAVGHPGDHDNVPQHRGVAATRSSTARHAPATGAANRNGARGPRAKRDRRRHPRALVGLGAVSLALVVAGCGAAAGSSGSPAGSGTGATQKAPAAPTGTASKASAGTAAPHAAAAKTTPAAPAKAPVAPAKAPAAPAPVATTPAAAPPAPPKAATRPPEKAAKANPDAGIPQGNGGDADPDNVGGPNDGDGNI